MVFVPLISSVSDPDPDSDPPRIRLFFHPKIRIRIQAIKKTNIGTPDLLIVVLNHLNHLQTIVKPLALAPLSLQSLDATESSVLGWAERFLSWFPDAMDSL